MNRPPRTRLPRPSLPPAEFLDFYTQLLTAGEVAERMAATIAKEEKLRLAKK